MVSSPATLLAQILGDSIDHEAFYRLVGEHADELAPKRVSDPREHARAVALRALELLARDSGLFDMAEDGVMSALRDWYDEGEL